MSYILDALKRAENERTSGAATDSSSSRGGSQDPRLHPATMILAGATLFLAGIGVAALLLKTGAGVPRPDPPAQAASAQPPPVVQAAVAASRPQPVADAPAREEAAEPPAERLALEDYGSFDDITPVFQGTGGGAAGTAPVATADAPPAAPDAGATAVAAPETGTLRLGAPRLDDLPADYRARFPRLQLQVHVHDDDPARRWILVDGQRYAEGSVLSQGPRVVEILSDGVIFEFSGQQALWPLAR